MYNRIVLNIGVVAVSGITVRFQLLDGGIKPRPATFPPLKNKRIIYAFGGTLGG